MADRSLPVSIMSTIGSGISPLRSNRSIPYSCVMCEFGVIRSHDRDVEVNEVVTEQVKTEVDLVYGRAGIFERLRDGTDGSFDVGLNGEDLQIWTVRDVKVVDRTGSRGPVVGPSVRSTEWIPWVEPSMTSSIRAASSTDLVSGPTPRNGVWAMNPSGRWALGVGDPTVRREEPLHATAGGGDADQSPTSDPGANGVRPAATAIAFPPDEPPAVFVTSNVVPVDPTMALSVASL